MEYIQKISLSLETIGFFLVLYQLYRPAKASLLESKILNHQRWSETLYKILWIIALPIIVIVFIRFISCLQVTEGGGAGFRPGSHGYSFSSSCFKLEAWQVIVVILDFFLPFLAYPIAITAGLIVTFFSKLTNGNAIAGIGLSIATIGLSLEFYQVTISGYGAFALII